MADEQKMDVDQTALQDHFEETLASKSTESDDAKATQDISGDGGVMKEIIKEGDGWEKPVKGSDVTGSFSRALFR